MPVGLAPDFPWIASMQDQLREYYARKILAALPEMIDREEIQFGNTYEFFIKLSNAGMIPDTSSGLTIRQQQNIYDPKDFGAVYDGVTDNSAICQQVADALPEHSVFMISGKLKATFTLNTRYVTVVGPGTLYNGTINVGTQTDTRRDLFITFQGLAFEDNRNIQAGTKAIQFYKARAVTVDHCFFYGHDQSIYVNPLPNAVAHDTGMIDMTANRFSNCNYAFYADKDPAVTWMHLSDSHFVNNTVNVAVISQVYIKAVDGMHIIGNTFFFPNYGTSNPALKAAKKQNIYIGQSNWVFICHNNLFEAGEEAILMDQASRATISDNLIAWPGQKVISDAIKLTGNNTLNAMVNDNIISKFTGNAISIYATGVGTISLKDNAVEYDATTPSYYGTPALDTIQHYSIYQDVSSPVTMIEQGNDMSGGLYVNRKGSLISSLRITNDAGISASNATISVPASTATPIFTLNSGRFGSLSIQGEILMEVKAGNTENSNLASYVLHVARSSGSNYEIREVSKLGLVAGTNANWPSFTWSIDNATGKLTATPVGVTAGTFYFNALSSGNLRLV